MARPAAPGENAQVEDVPNLGAETPQELNACRIELRHNRLLKLSRGNQAQVNKHLQQILSTQRLVKAEPCLER